MADDFTVGMGRRHAPDARDLNWPMRRLLDPLQEFFPKGLPMGVRYYVVGPRRDQGNTGTCVAHGWMLKLESSPIMQTPGATPYDLYRKFVLVDEWADNDGEAIAPDAGLQSGTSVRAGAKTLQSMGYIQNYLWAANAEDVRAWHLSNFGGVVLGVNWTSQMMRTDSEGFVNYHGVVEGGHCVATYGWNDRIKHNGRYVRAVRFQQSWKLPWGDAGTGRAWIEYDDLDRLLADDGEACAATEFRVTR